MHTILLCLFVICEFVVWNKFSSEIAWDRYAFLKSLDYVFAGNSNQFLISTFLCMLQWGTCLMLYYCKMLPFVIYAFSHVVLSVIMTNFWNISVPCLLFDINILKSFLPAHVVILGIKLTLDIVCPWEPYWSVSTVLLLKD